MTAPNAILDLVERFARNRTQYLNPAYNETQVRREFLDPFFSALGWDVDNTSGYAQQYKDVVHEDAIKVGLDSRAPDYSFRIGGVRKFFVEAKKPAVNLHDDPAPAYQLRRYAWSAKLPLSILTDFQELSVYDCRLKPTASDKPSVGRIIYLSYEEYESRWGEIASVFAKEAILQGSFDTYAQSTKGKKGTAEVDKAFLAEIETWRDTLAHNIALRNSALSQRELNYAVQATIDRLIFLRICEDRGIEPYGRLQGLLNGTGTYGRLRSLFVEADARYNSGLFHFSDEKGRPGYADRLSLTLAIDDKVLKDIVKRLYYPESPYEFSVLPADILGQVYEQFLGKVIRLTAGHRAVVEDKPEVKKAGGVYYTPTYIVDYIVKHTVGKLLEGKTSKQAAELRILDPACGSGSFLIGAYQYLLDWHRDLYVAEIEKAGAKKAAKTLYQGRGGEWRLTTAERKRILLNNIYGVDIDAQAVETTKLSLLLKVLEGETADSIDAQLSFLHERALPDLAANIKCGNSLIGPDFYDGEQLGLAGLDEEERYRINVFDWEAEFPEILGPAVPEERRGFDAVIGNPPYIRIQNLKEFAPREVEFYKRRYVSASKGNYDIYVVFVERGLSLLSERGLLGYILPHKFMNAKYGESLRGLLSGGRHVADVVHFGHQQVFVEASTYTCLLFLGRSGRDMVTVSQVDDLMAWRRDGAASSGHFASTQLTGATWTLSTGATADLLERLRARPLKLSDVTDRIFQGIKTSCDAVYIVEELERADGRVRVRSAATGTDHWLEPDLLHPLVKGGDSRRYRLARTNRLILFPYQRQGVASGLVSAEMLAHDLPLTWQYLLDNRSTLEARERGRMRGPSWYGYGRTQALDVMPLPKLFTPDIAPQAAFSWDPSGECFFTGGVAGGYGILPRSGIESEFLLGLLNSRLLDWVVKQTATAMRGGWYSFESRFIRDLPIVVASHADDDGLASRAMIIGYARDLLRLAEQLQAVRTGREAALLQREFEAIDSRINRAVYSLYGLTEDEIAVVEGG